MLHCVKEYTPTEFATAKQISASLIGRFRFYLQPLGLHWRLARSRKIGPKRPCFPAISFDLSCRRGSKHRSVNPILVAPEQQREFHAMRSAVATVLRAPYDFARRYRMSCFAKLRSECPSWFGKDSTCFVR